MQDRDAAIKAIRTALRERTGRTWSVTGGRGTAWGWITITAPPARRGEYGNMNADDAETLHKALDLPPHSCGTYSNQSVSIPASSAYRDEYIARAEGRTPLEYGTQYWD